MHRTSTIFIALLLVAGAVAPLAAQEFTPDAHTLMLLHGNGTLIGAAGETPTASSGVAFTGGVFAQGADMQPGAQVHYAAAGNLSAASGTIEFWLQPHWNGDDWQDHVVLAWGTWAGMLVVKDGANNLRLMINRWGDYGLPERGAAFNIADWTAGQWHHCAFTWDGDEVRAYADGVLRASGVVGFTPPGPGDATFQVGGEGEAGAVDGVLDELRISDVVRSAAEVESAYLAGLVPTSLAVTPRVTRLWETWPVYTTLVAATQLGERALPPSVAAWSTSDASVVAVQSDGMLRATGPGGATLTATFRGVSGSCAVTVRAPVLAPTHETLPADLTTPAADAVWQVPVLVVRYFATADGVNLDTSISPGYWSDDPRTLADLDAHVLAMNRRAKFTLEQGSRFRAYSDQDARPSLGYRVVDQVTVYEQTPPGKVLGIEGGYPSWEPDWFAIFERLDVRHYVEDLGVKEVWVWTGGMGLWPSFDPLVDDVQDFRSGWESNMASPLTGDISNSNRDNSDLPVYDSTYVVYGYNFGRSQAEAVHDHGHQIEAQFAHANGRQDGNEDLFWKRWRGQDPDGNRVTGRCGDTHSPPNTVADYDYENTDVVWSDIADWTWDASGTFAPVDVHTWGDLQWPWPDGVMDFSQRVETQWYMYWLMSMPGFDNGLAYEDEALTNWWQFIGDWDGAITAGRGLHGNDSLAAAPHASSGDGALLLSVRAQQANPSAGMCAFTVEAGGADIVTAEVLDVRGHRVRRLVTTTGGGTFAVAWDGRDDHGRAVAGGTYLLRVLQGARSAVRKVAIVR